MCNQCDFLKCGALVLLVLVLISSCTCVSGFESISRSSNVQLRQNSNPFQSRSTTQAIASIPQIPQIPY